MKIETLRLGLWWLVLVAWAGPVVAQTPLSFRDALTMARQRNQQLRAAEAQVQRARAARSAERGLYFPIVSATGLYAHMNDRLFVDLDPFDRCSRRSILPCRFPISKAGPTK
jgi:hypothetical protein